MFESLESTTVRAVILCPAASIRDVMNKTGMCETSVKYATILPFFFHLLVQNEPIWLRPEKLKFEVKTNKQKTVFFFVHMFIEQPLEACRYKETNKQANKQTKQKNFFYVNRPACDLASVFT